MAIKCYHCDQPSDTACSLCKRPICSDHQVKFAPDLAPLFGTIACIHCYHKTLRELEKEKSQREKKRSRDLIYRTCAFCGRVFTQTLPLCSICQRPVCHLHHKRYRKKFRWGSRDKEYNQWYWDYDVRCLNHPRRTAWLWGWEIDPADETI